MAGFLAPSTACFSGTPHVDVNWTSVVFALAVTIYFWWENIKGIDGVQRKSAAGHAGHHRDGGDPACLVGDHAC